LIEQCEEVGVTVMPGVKVDRLLQENGAVVGISAGEDELRAHVVIAADGVNSFIAREAGIRTKEPQKHLAVGVKSVIGLPKKVLEDRFNVRENDGVAYAMVGDCTEGVAGGAFMYTNTDSISLGVVLRLDDLVKSGKSSSDIHDHLLAHPAVAPLLEDGELLEYGCHLTIEDGPAMVKQDLTRPGLILVGDAAGFTLNTGLTIRGMDLAAGSALAAAKTVVEALDAGDFSQTAMDRYKKYLDESFVGADMKTYEPTPKFLETERMYGAYGKLAADVFYGVFNHDLTPRKRLVKVALGALKSSGIKMTTVMRDGLKAIRSL
ncbi:MAG: FAD-dependent oxidoreductase, partial [Arcanobacterium sp.]|nr:FAD-dependent oxidoreductase [Arcanobacterium sp.]